MKNQNRLYLLTGIVLLVAIGLTSFSPRPLSKGYNIGDVATDFKLKNVDGKIVSMADFKEAKGFIVIFSCNSCPYVIAYEDRMNDLDKKYAPLGFPVIAINPNNPEISPGDSFKKMQERAKEKGFTFPYVFDEKQEVFPKYGATRTPHVYLLEKTDKGNIVRYIGAIDDNYKDAASVKVKFLENAVDALLEKREVPVKTTKAIGCTIKV